MQSVYLQSNVKCQLNNTCSLPEGIADVQRTVFPQTAVTAVTTSLFVNSASDWLKCATVACQPCVHYWPIGVLLRL
ncbi:unnamed protein product [Pleuronectes platessa]|uniref:Uncharacterized protein n=1 Tax=Pleuronectes platessa TaxID=8262 RepID=A0A9N7YTE9_PLEPL|nr:unnamed protein product [Pleuronectes platessa]